MKNIIYITIVCLAFASCGKPKAPKSLPVEKVYIMEFDLVHQGWDGDTEEPLWGIELLGLAELRNDFMLKITKETEEHSGKYFETEYSFPDSLRSEINRIVKENQRDTAYVYEYSSGINKIDDRPRSPYYQIIIERKFYESTRIIFHKDLLPEDLKTLFQQVYNNPIQKREEPYYQDFVSKVEDVIVKSLRRYNALEQMIPPPPPILRETVKMIAPEIVEDIEIETDPGLE